MYDLLALRWQTTVRFLGMYGIFHEKKTAIRVLGIYLLSGYSGFLDKLD